ncbi:MAG: sorbosone dehydrogenase family protein [Proteobacteria bacterium]|nr:sorbosone dehydrogenase family protein [Pseudomonadota bacterium]
MTGRIRVALALLVAGFATPSFAEEPVRRGAAAFGDWRSDAPGVRRHITADALPKPYATKSASHPPHIVKPPTGIAPKLPPGFTASVLASGLSGPRLLRTAPNGDVFVAEMNAGRIRVIRGADSGTPSVETYAEDLTLPFGINFYPAGPDPKWLYVANTDSVVRFPYRSGDAKPRGRPETVVSSLPTGGHVTRDLVFSADGTRMFVSVGSESNVGTEMKPKSVPLAKAWDSTQHAVGAGWDGEALRAAVLSFTPDGKDRRIFATGIRNCVGLAVQRKTGDLWCSTNERDGLGDDLVPDYITRVRKGAFYGWPWYYLGSNEDPRHKGERPDLARQVTVPDVLLQAHSASLQLAFYDGGAFPPEYRGSIFAAEHGSWNREHRTGYKVIRVIVKDGKPTGEYEDFMTGLVLNDNEVWARPVGIAVSRDGALLVSEDGNGTVWRITYRKP